MLQRLALAAVAAVLAGCASAPAAELPVPAVEGPAAAPQVLDWGQVDCESMTWSIPVLASSLQPYLPEGFQPTEPTAGQAPLAAGQAATLGFRAVECTEGFGEGDILRSVQSGGLFTPVIPPVELREDRFAGQTAFGWDFLVSSDAWRDAAEGWGMPVHDGGSMVGPTAQGWTGALAMDKVGAFTLTGRTFDADHPVDTFDARTITLGDRGFALWDGTLEHVRVSTGVGVWNVSPESWVADVLGATQGAATFERATWSMPAATVHWPGQSVGPVEEEGSSIGNGPGGLPPLSPKAAL